MTRRSDRSGDGVSLFPFLSILVCVIGVLTLMIAGAALTEMESKPDLNDVARTNRFQDLNKQLAENQRQIVALEKQLQSAQPNQKIVEELKARRAALEKEKTDRDEADELARKILALMRERDLLKERMASLQKEMESRLTLVAELEEEIKRKGTPPPAKVSIRPGGSGEQLDATFVECTDTAILILDGDEPTRVRGADLATDPTYQALLDRVAGSDRATIIFLLRDNATPTYWAARGIAQQRGARNGKLPILGQGEIDLSAVTSRRPNRAED